MHSSASLPPFGAEVPRYPPFGGLSGAFGGGESRSTVEAKPLGALDGVRAVARAQLAVERARVLLDGVRRQIEGPGDLAIGRSPGDQTEDLRLAVGQRRDGRVVALPEDLLPITDHADH